MITASVGVDSSLLLEPARELLFPLPGDTTERPRCYLTLTNLSPLNDVVFRVRTRNPDAFSVRPTHGLLAPGASSHVIITVAIKTCDRLGAMDPRDLMTRQSSELFLVQSVEREEEVQALGPLDSKSSTSLRAFWKKVPRECITENKMVCRFTGGARIPPSEVPQNTLSRSMSSASSSSEYRSSRSENRSLSMSAREMRLSRSGSGSEQSRLNRSFSNQFTPPERREERRSRQQSFTSDTSFHTTIEPPIMDRKSEARMSTSTRSKQRDTMLSSISVTDSSVSDTMLTAISTNTAAGESTHELGPLLYHIQPSDVLSFNVKPAPRFWGSTYLFIVNSSQNDCLSFKVRTSNQSSYVVKPSRGLVSTTNAQEVVVSLCAPRGDNGFDPEEREAKDGFMIEVANISRDKYGDLMKLDERTRTREISSLWSLLPRNNRQSTMLSVQFKMEGRYCSSDTHESSESGNSDSRSRSSGSVSKSRIEEPQRQKLHSVVQGMENLSTSSSTDQSPESAATNNFNSSYRCSDSDESAFTIAPTPAPTEVGGDESDDDVTYSSVSDAPANSAVIVVSADRMDTVDFSNPKLSFFI